MDKNRYFLGRLLFVLILLPLEGYAWVGYDEETKIYTDQYGSMSVSEQFNKYKACMDQGFRPRGEYETKNEYKAYKERNKNNCSELKAINLAKIKQPVSLSYDVDAEQFTFTVFSAARYNAIKKWVAKYWFSVINLSDFVYDCAPSSFPKDDPKISSEFRNAYKCEGDKELETSDRFFGKAKYLWLSAPVRSGTRCVETFLGKCERHGSIVHISERRDYAKHFKIIVSSKVEKARALKSMEKNLELVITGTQRLHDEGGAFRHEGSSFDVDEIRLVDKESHEALLELK